MKYEQNVGLLRLQRLPMYLNGIRQDVQRVDNCFPEIQHLSELLSKEAVTISFHFQY